MEYTAEDGFKVLKYIGIMDVTDAEKETFRNKWGEYFRLNGKDLIGTIWELYTDILPYVHKGASSPEINVAFRDLDFNEKLKRTGLETKLKQGIPLEAILQTA